MSPTFAVYPGDAVKTILLLNEQSGLWFDNFVVIPGSMGAAAREVAFGDGITFNPSSGRNDTGLFTDVGF